MYSLTNIVCAWPPVHAQLTSCFLKPVLGKHLIQLELHENNFMYKDNGLSTQDHHFWSNILTNRTQGYKMKITIQEILEGSILDVGGGGECVIGQIYGRKVIAIDDLQEELDEAPDCCEKRLMDATNLLFTDASFDNVTFFYSLMYMTNETQRKAIGEAARVLKQGGRMFIWDSKFPVAYPDPYIVHIDIHFGLKNIRTSYGIVKNEAQKYEDIVNFIISNGLSLEHNSKTDDHFFISARKA